MSDKYGVITEQGDLGLGFDVLKDKDQKAYNEAVQKESKENTQVINEENK